MVRDLNQKEIPKQERGTIEIQFNPDLEERDWKEERGKQDREMELDLERNFNQSN